MQDLNQGIQEYLNSRKKLIDLGRKYKNLFSGNDNMIGRIGEYIAMDFLRQKEGQNPKKVPETNNKGFDLKQGKLTTQVKVITSENERGRTVRLIPPWEQFVLIHLDLETGLSKIGLITRTQFNQALKENKKFSKQPVVKTTMLGPKGLFRYGKVVDEYRIAGL